MGGGWWSTEYRDLPSLKPTLLFLLGKKYVPKKKGGENGYQRSEYVGSVCSLSICCTACTVHLNSTVQNMLFSSLLLLSACSIVLGRTAGTAQKVVLYSQW